MPRPAGHPLAAALTIVAAMIALALAGPGGRGATAPEPLSQAPAAGDADADGAAGGGGSLDIDFAQILSCGSVEPARERPSGKPPRIAVSRDSVGDVAELRRLTREVAARIEALRGLRFEDPIEVAFLDDAGLRRRIDVLAKREASPRLARLEGRALTALGAVPEDVNLLRLSRETLEGQVAGLYVPTTGELLVRSSDGDPGVIEVLTVAHELEHALADQALGLPVRDHPDPRRSDAEAARLALVEGDATLSMQLYSEGYLSLVDQLSLLGEDSLGDSQAQFDDLPDFLQRQLVFPYFDGLSYVCDRAADRGPEGIDRAYRRPPRSTWELLFPDRDPGARPIAPAPPGELASPWRSVARTQLGAAELSWLFAAPGGDPARALEDPEEAAAGWAGSSVELWTAGRRSALGISLAARGGGLCGSVRAWWRATEPAAAVTSTASGAFLADGAERDAAIACSTGSVRVGIAPDPETARALVAPG